jgi:phosphopantothenoylcysteine decarboxylase/phosphopantothenate--cysteine ligase
LDIKHKKVLITAGPTWVSIDSVRVISNIATGETGILLAEKLVKEGARVTLLLGPVGACCIDRRIRVINFKFFDELRNCLKKELRVRIYDIVIHNAAVSDFKAERQARGKLTSGKSYTLKLSPLPKLAKEIKVLNPKAKLVIFKLESVSSDKALIQRAKLAKVKLKADLTVANRINPYRAFIIDRTDKVISTKSKKELVDKLIKIL